MKEEILGMDHVTTDDPELTNLDNMTLHIFKGEITGLLPVNEQGRKKLLEVMCRNVPLHYGRVYIGGRLVNSHLKSDRASNRVCVISGKNRLVRDLTVCDNLFVLRRGFRQYVLDRWILCQQAERFLRQSGLEIAPDMMADQANELERVVIELVRAIVQRADLIIFDEISSFLSVQDVLRLHEMMRFYVKEGFSFLYLGNHHEDVISFCDRVLVMKNGYIIKVLRDKDMTDREILQIAGSEEYPELYMQLERMAPLKQAKSASGAQGPPALEFRNVSNNHLRHLSFQVRPGECVVLLDRGMLPAGETLSLLKGQNDAWEGEIICDGKVLTNKKKFRLPCESAAVIEEYAHTSMIFPHMTFLENLCIMADRKLSSVLLRKRIMKSVRREYADVFGDDIDATDMRSVSRENKYALVYYRYAMLRPKVLFCVRPFTGADMYLRRHILTLIQKLKQRGIAVVILTTALADSHFAADRLLILDKGELVCELHRDDFKSAWNTLFKI